MEFVEVKAGDTAVIEEIIAIEEENFGKNGGVDIWILKPVVRYGKVFVIKEEGAVVSVAEYLQKFQSEEVYLYGISSKYGSQRKGYGKELMKKSIEYFKNKGMKKISLTVAPENISAVEFYKKLGFYTEMLQEEEYGQNIDRLYMVKKLDTK